MGETPPVVHDIRYVFSFFHPPLRPQKLLPKLFSLDNPILELFRTLCWYLPSNLVLYERKLVVWRYRFCVSRQDWCLAHHHRVHFWHSGSLYFWRSGVREQQLHLPMLLWPTRELSYRAGEANFARNSLPHRMVRMYNLTQGCQTCLSSLPVVDRERLVLYWKRDLFLSYEI